jgi:hypothetical protein
MDVQEQGALTQTNFNFKLLKSLREEELLEIFGGLLEGQLGGVWVREVQALLAERGVLGRVRQRILCFL